MSEVMDLNDINERDEEREQIKVDADIERTFRCSWCGAEWMKSELVIIDDIKLCKVCHEILIRK